ncbi:MAG: DUF3120 domain-containing protein [Cyanobacteriota bacterium]|jgi:hypothetical protein
MLPAIAALLVVLPVFLQAPWVRASPMGATLFTPGLVALGVVLQRRGQGPWSAIGAMLVGFAGSWLGGSLFWGWWRVHPLWHLPIEGFALPLALGGLGSRWRLAGAFYLASLLGTAATDGVMALTGVMHLWPQVVEAPLSEAGVLLQQAGEEVLQPMALALIGLSGTAILAVCCWLWPQGLAGRVAAATLATTLVVDGIFLAAALLAPGLSGLI